jgi:hypothetical protein
MAVTNFSPLLGLALPTTGDLSGTWGTTVNDSITQLLDSAVAGTTTLSADADVTLSTTNGAANQARNAVILWTASNGANTRNITAPAQSKAYLVINSGTGPIVIRGAGPTTGVTLPAGARALVAWNGSDFVKIVSNPVVLTTDVSGTLPVANGGTGATTLTSNNVILGNGTSAVQFVAPGTSGNILASNGTTWTSAPLPAGGLTYIFTTTSVTAVDKQGVLTDTSGGAFTVTLPATPSVGAQVVIADAGSFWGTNNLTVARNGSTIGGLAENLICDITGASVQFVYDGTTWEVYAQVGGNGGTAVTLAGVQTLTNKTIAFADNTLTDVAGTTATQTLTNKTLGATTLSGTLSAADQIIDRAVLEDYAIQGSAIGATGATATIDMEVANFFSATLDQACTFTFSNPPASGDFGAFVLELTNGGAFTVTYPASVDFPGGTAPTLTAAGVDQLVFTTRDGGTTYFGFVAGLDIKSP